MQPRRDSAQYPGRSRSPSSLFSLFTDAVVTRLLDLGYGSTAKLERARRMIYNSYSTGARDLSQFATWQRSKDS